MARVLRGAPARPRAIMARGGRLPRAAGRPPRSLRTGHRCAIGLSEAHLQAARRDARHTPEREARGCPSIAFVPSGLAGPAGARATFRVPAEGDPDVDVAVASAAGCSPPPPRSLTPPRPPLSDQRGRAARRCSAAQIVWEQQTAARAERVESWLLASECGSARSICVPVSTDTTRTRRGSWRSYVESSYGGP